MRGHRRPCAASNNACGPVRNLRPGGWVELQDVDGEIHSDDNTVPPDWPLARFLAVVDEGFALFKTDMHAARRGGDLLASAGFVDIHHFELKLPYGTWPADPVQRIVGSMYRQAAESFFPAVGALHFPMLGWSKEQTELLFMECRRCLRDPSVHAYGKMHFWYARKPF